MSEGEPNNVWSCGDIASNASSWTLASDIGLLKHLEAFSDRVLESSRRVGAGVDDLLSRLDETSLSLDLARNDFSSLSNVQFIESRIYEEDETANKREPDETQNVQAKENTKEDLKRAALRGLAVIERYFERVDVPESDSEDETGLNFVLRAKDPYISRPLPYVIGTEEWYRSSNAGMLDSSSDSEVENVPEKYSDDSEDEEEIGEDSKADATKSEASEEELSNKLEKPVANSTFNDANKNGDAYDGVSQYNSATIQAPISQTSFAEQLAQKLGNVINGNQAEANVNTRPIQKQQQSNYGRLFSNEPPPIDNDDMFTNQNNRGLFSGGDGLFDGLDDDVSFWGEKSTPKKSEDSPKPSLQAEKTLQDENAPINKTISNKKTVDNLFDPSSSSSDDELFPNTEPKKPQSVPKKPESLFEENAPPKPGNEALKSKKLTLFDDTQSSEDDDMFATKPSKTESTTKKKLNLFDDDSDNPEDLFKPVSSDITKPDSSNLFDAENDTEDVFNNNDVVKETIADSTKQSNSKKVPNLFSDSGSDSDDLFSPNNFSSKPKIISINKSKEKDETPPEEPKTNGPKIEINESKEKNNLSLFDDDDAVDDWLTVGDDGNVEVTPEPETKPLDDPAGVSFEPPNIFEDIPSIKNIFDENDLDDPSKADSTPSPDRRPWGNEETADDDGDDAGQFSAERHRSSIFDDEPPSPFYESSGIVRDPTGSDRIETDVSSFYPYASSSRRLSAADTVGACSEDSLFAAKPPPRRELPRVEDTISDRAGDEPVSSYVDITPSGRESELYSEPVGHSSKPRKSVTFEDNIKVLVGNSSEADKAPDAVFKEPNIERQDHLKEETAQDESTNQNDEIQKASEEKSSPGKLKHNLNINVQALLPGGGGAVRKILSKPQRPASLADVPNYEDYESALRPDATPSGQQVEVLQSITKMRARIPNRRPSTKRGREAFRKSCVELPTQGTAAENADESDLLIINRLSVTEVSKEATVTKTSKARTSFVRSDDFASPEFNQPDLFDNDNDDDLFSEKKLPPKSKILKKNLFDDDEDDIDFFQSISQPNKAFSTGIRDYRNDSKAARKSTLTTTAVKKLENVKVTEDDPLNAFDR